MPKVSVIVPVYNPGHHIDDCIRTLLGQTLPAGDVELIFVDDGSTDGTPARLDALAAEHAHVRVEHIPNSGWPGRPRNVGIDMARGDYVFFVDNDDWLGAEALERLHGTAVTDAADIVLGKVVGEGKTVPRVMFRQNLHGVPFESASLLGLLTPHKLFRRAFLAEHELRFPEGRRRLEDHQFVVAAYFHAERISVVADYPVYHWVHRAEEQNASAGRFDAEGYFDNVREVLDMVDAMTEPGPWRDRLKLHWYRGKMLGRVGGAAFLARDAEYRRELYEAVRRLALERYDDAAADRLPLNLRVRARLLRDGAYEGLEALAALEQGLRATVKVRRIQDPGPHMVIRLEARLAGRDEPLTFVRDGERIAWRPPEALSGALGDLPLDVTGDVEDPSVQVYLHNVEDGSQYVLPAKTEVRLNDRDDGTVRPVLVVTARVTPTTGAAGSPLPAGQWEVRTSVNLAGFSAARRVRRRNQRPLILTAIPPGRIVKGTPKAAPVPQPKLVGRLLKRLRAAGGATARG